MTSATLNQNLVNMLNIGRYNVFGRFVLTVYAIKFAQTDRDTGFAQLCRIAIILAILHT